MAKTVSEEVLKHFALTLTDDVKINASATGDNEEISLLNYIREGLGECKIINDPQFFFWSYKLLSDPAGWDFRKCVEKGWLPEAIG